MGQGDRLPPFPQLEAFLSSLLSCLMPVQINTSCLPVLPLSHAQTNPKLLTVVPPENAAEREVFYLFYILQRELTLLQTDGSCSSLTLGMAIHGLVCALKLVWLEVVYEARVCWLLLGTLPGALVMGPGEQSHGSVFPRYNLFPELSRAKAETSELQPAPDQINKRK